MSISLIVFLYLYLLFVFIWLIFSLIALYHIVIYGQIGFISLLAISIYLAASVVILYLSYQYLSRIDWSIAINIFQGGLQFFIPNNF